MKIALYGMTGMVGSRIAAEALARGHTVTAIVRDPARVTLSHSQLTVLTGDVTDQAQVAAQIAGHDAAVGSISGRRDGDAGQIVAAAETLIAAATESGVKRVVWVGGAGSLEVAPGVRLLDSPDFPDAYKPEAQAGADVLARFRQDSTLDWTFFSPAIIIEPGVRTGTYQLGGDQVVFNANGESRISVEDYAVALIDELEQPKHIRQRFTAAY